jgi:hypothetical protein
MVTVSLLMRLIAHDAPSFWRLRLGHANVASFSAFQHAAAAVLVILIPVNVTSLARR